MATSPKVHLGLSRTFDLLESLISDFNQAMEMATNEQESQFLRRVVIRNGMSFIEGTIQILKYEIKRAFRLSATSYQLSDKQREIVHEKKITESGTEAAVFIPFDQNFLKTFKLANKILIKTEEPFLISKEEKDLIIRLKNTRNRLTHPRTYYDIEITDHEIYQMILLFNLTRVFFRKVINARKSIDELVEHESEEKQTKKAIRDYTTGYLDRSAVSK